MVSKKANINNIYFFVIAALRRSDLTLSVIRTPLHHVES